MSGAHAASIGSRDGVAPVGEPVAVPAGGVAPFPDPLASDPALRQRSAPLRGIRHSRVAEVEAALAGLAREGRLRPDQVDYGREHRRRFAEAAVAIGELLANHPDWPRCRVLEVGSSITPMLYRRLFPPLRLSSACLFGHSQLAGIVEEAVKIDLEQVDLRDGPALPLRGLDLVLLCEVLEHLVVNPANLFRALAGSLAPGGLLYVTTPNFFSAARRRTLAAGLNPQPIVPAGAGPADRFHHHVREYAMAELLAAMREAGLVPEVAYYSDCWDDPAAAAALPEDALGNLVVLGRLPPDAPMPPPPARPAPSARPAPAAPPVPASGRPERYALMDLARGGGARRLARPDGLHYHRVLRLLHERLHVRRYIEIGFEGGDALDLARGAAVRVDPADAPPPPALAGRPDRHLFRMTSDAFFATQDVTAILGGPADLGFVDGMRHVEVALRDLMNCEARSHPGGAVAMHDVVPLRFAMARRRDTAPDGGPGETEGTWTGDVWRVLRVLRRWRPDLRVNVVDAPPTCLAVVTGLDPDSRVLRDRMDEILAEEEALGNTEEGWWEEMGRVELLNGRALAEPGRLRLLLGLPG